jgi:glycosyltransferase involved in cell wall biosynthesis
MHILTLSNAPLNSANGSGYVVCGYADRLRRQGHEVEVLGPPDYELLYGLRRAIGYRQTLGMARAVRRRLAARAPDLVEIYGAEGGLAFSRLAAQDGRRPLLVAHSNGIENHCTEVLAAAGKPYPRHWWQPDPRRLREWAFRSADAIVTVSSWDAEYALAQGYAPKERVLAIDNPLPDDYLGLPLDLERGPEIGFAGAWLPRKGVERMRRELPGVLRRHADWRLTLVGVGDGFRAAEHFPADLLARISVVPRAERGGELKDLYRRFAIVLVPSLYESFGLVTAEAMACGAAVVASTVGYAASLRHEGEVLLLREGEAPLAAAVERLIGDEALRRRIAAGGFRRAQALRWDDAARRLATAYEEWHGQHRVFASPRRGG